MTAPTEPISTQLPCHNCGYDLRAHPPDGKCPECEASVAESRRIAAIPRRPAWRDSDPRWRRRMLAGAWLLVLLPLMDLLKALKWTSNLSVPAVFEVGENLRTLDDTFLSNFRVYQILVFCMGVVLLFSKEQGRRRSPLDWTRRWGVLCSYVVMLLAAAGILIVSALVLAGLAALFQSMPPKYQPPFTQLFVDISAAWLRYGLYPKDVTSIVLVAFSSITVLLACIPVYDALRSTGPKRLAAILLAPLVLFSLMHIAQAARFYFDPTTLKGMDIYFLGLYFRPEMLVSYVTGIPTEWLWLMPDLEFSVVIVEAAKWCIVLTIALWLSIAQFRAWRQRKKAKTA